MTRLLCIAIILLSVVAGCGLADSGTSTDIIDANGTIEQLGEGGAYFIAADHAPPGVRTEASPYYLYPTNLLAAYQRGGLRVNFDATIEECDDVGQCLAMAVTLVRIRRLK